MISPRGLSGTGRDWREAFRDVYQLRDGLNANWEGYN